MQARSITKRMSKKDANSFLKTVKKFGRIERMADIAEDVGPVLKDQSASARYRCLSRGLSKALSQKDHATLVDNGYRVMDGNCFVSPTHYYLAHHRLWWLRKWFKDGRGNARIALLI